LIVSSLSQYVNELGALAHRNIHKLCLIKKHYLSKY